MIRFLLIFVLLNCVFINAQNPYSINYTISDGLPSNNIYSIFQDDNGFLWFTTDVGVVKFDSNTFKLFSTDDGLSDNEVFQMKKDYLGRKWLLTLNGTPSIIEDGSIYNETNSKLLKNIKSKSMLLDFYEDKNKTIYFSSRKGEVTSLNKNNEILKTYLDKTTIFGVWSYKAEVFALTANGIYNISKKAFQTKQLFPTISRLFHTANATYISTGNILYRIDENNFFKKLIELDEFSEIINLYKEDENTFWICTRQGLYLFKNQIKINSYFEDCIVSDILKDNEGNFWVSTLNKGLLFVPSFEVIVLQNANKENIKINCIAVRSANEVWFGGIVNDYYIKKKKHFIKKNLNTSWRKDNINPLCI